MIIKSYEFFKKKIDNKFKFFLFYGDNQGYKEEIIKKFINQEKNIFRYFESEILNNKETFYNSISSQSLFEEEKIIIIQKSTDKIFDYLEEIIIKDYSNIKIIIEAGILEKKSKLRNFFEKEKKIICVPFYPDNQQTLNILASDFLKEHNIKHSNEMVNFITSKANGDRKYLSNELFKIRDYCRNKTINLDVLKKIIFLTEDHNISNIVDKCLAKERNKLTLMINENIITNDDTVLMIRIFLFKAKRILDIRQNFELTKNLTNAIETAKPPIFWKEKKVVETQVKLWSIYNIKKLIVEINKTELLIKKNMTLGLFILLNFIYKTAKN